MRDVNEKKNPAKFSGYNLIYTLDILLELEIRIIYLG